MNEYKMTADILTKEIKIWKDGKIVHRAIGYKDAKTWIREQSEKENKRKKGA